MTDQAKTVWVKLHGPSRLWYVLRDWLYGGASVESHFESKDDAIARAHEVADEHDAQVKVYEPST